jgi:hypothetical protein
MWVSGLEEVSLSVTSKGGRIGVFSLVGTSTRRERAEKAGPG